MIGMSYRDLIGAILSSAISRVHKGEYSTGFSACLGK
jgi:hypothetical protein